MSKMQTFYQQLFSSPRPDSPHWQRLSALTKTNPAQMSALKAAPAWHDWETSKS